MRWLDHVLDNDNAEHNVDRLSEERVKRMDHVMTLQDGMESPKSKIMAQLWNDGRATKGMKASVTHWSLDRLQ